MPARPRGSATRGSFRLPSTIRKMDKRKTAKTPTPSGISSRVRSNPPVRSRSSRPARDTALSRQPLRRRQSLSPEKSVSRKPRDEPREERLSIESKRTVDTTKNIRRTPEKKYFEKQYEGLGKEQQRPSYTKESMKSINVRISNNYKDKFSDTNYDPNPTCNRTFNPENVFIVRRAGKNVKKVLLIWAKKAQRKKFRAKP